MTGTKLRNSTVANDLAGYATGNPFTVGSTISIVTTTGDAIYGSSAKAWTLTNAGVVDGFVDGVFLNSAAV
jgi:hypothetical protein